MPFLKFESAMKHDNPNRYNDNHLRVFYKGYMPHSKHQLRLEPKASIEGVPAVAFHRLYNLKHLKTTEESKLADLRREMGVSEEYWEKLPMKKREYKAYVKNRVKKLI